MNFDMRCLNRIVAFLLVLFPFMSSAANLDLNVSPVIGSYYEVGESFPIGFVEHNPEVVFETAKKLSQKFAKDEFESTAKYQERISNTEDLIKPFSLSEKLAFPVNVTARYDADKELASVNLQFKRRVDRDASKNTIAVDLKTIVRNSYAYTAMNAYGAKVEAESRKQDLIQIEFGMFEAYEYLGLLLDDSFKFQTSLYAECYVDFPMPPDVARGAIKNLSVIYVGKIVAPLLKSDSKFYAAELSDPVALTIDYQRLQLKPDSIYLINKNDGHILGEMGRDAASVASRCF